MTQYPDKVRRAGAFLAATFARFLEQAKLMLLSQRAVAMRAARKDHALKQKECEAERIDRLRNPSNYQGR